MNSAKNVLANAIYAFEINEKRIVKDSYVSDPDTGAKVMANRIIMLEKNPITDDHLAQADELTQYLQQAQMMQMLTKGHAEKFLTSIIDTLSKETCKPSDYGIIAWAPKLAMDLQRRDAVKQKSQEFEPHSKFMGKVGDKVDLTLTVIDYTYLPKVECFAVNAHDDNDNLFFYWAKTEDRVISGKVKARIKAHNIDERRGRAKVNVINYIKAVK